MKILFVLLCDAAAGRDGKAIEGEQDVQRPMRDTPIELCAMDCGLLRAGKSIESVGEGPSRRKIDVVRLCVDEAVPRIAASLRQVIGRSSRSADTPAEPLSFRAPPQALGKGLAPLGKADGLTPGRKWTLQAAGEEAGG